MRTWMTPIFAVALLATGCHFSKLDAQATVHISGRALDASGRPLASAQVRLFKEADLGELLVGAVLTVGSLGSVCLLPGAPAVCRQARVATTGADGTYSFDVKGADTQGSIGNEATLDLVVGDPKAQGIGASTTLRFTARSTTVQLPAARLWSASPRLSEANGHVRLTWSPLPAVDGQGVEYSAQLFDKSRQAPLWTQPATGRRVDIDARVLEDHPAVAAAAATTRLGSTKASYYSPRLAVKPIAGAPVSRHRPCLAVVGTAPTTARQRTCTATDGDLVATARLTAANAQVVTGAVVDLGSVHPISLVVARGVAGMFLVELSDDGVRYRTVAAGSSTTYAVSPPGQPAARFVRVRSPSGLDESLLTEISVW